jgi:GNAT superfamily N-acetyltransferase
VAAPWYIAHWLTEVLLESEGPRMRRLEGVGMASVVGAWQPLEEGPVEDSGLTFGIGLEGAERVVAVLKRGGAVVGTITLGPHPDFPRKKGSNGPESVVVWQVGNSGIDEDLQGKGIGKQFYRMTRDWLVSKWGAVMSSDVFRSSEANHLWNSLVRDGEAKLVPAGVTLPYPDPETGRPHRNIRSFYLMRKGN